MHQYCRAYTRLRSQKRHFALGRKSRWMPHFKSRNRELEGEKSKGRIEPEDLTYNKPVIFGAACWEQWFDGAALKSRSRTQKPRRLEPAKPRWRCRRPRRRSSVVLVRIHLCVGAVRVRFRSVKKKKKQTENNKSYRDALYWIFS